ncbi:ataxin-10-like isoform X2 [Ornithodoros turicata]|uniref:ataxin-10-like isoform X2 n=1 Tax=Ornithodoros turicata TaxID=34597 RepID=UPI003139D38F
MSENSVVVDLSRKSPSATTVARTLQEFNKEVTSKNNSKILSTEKWQSLGSILVGAASCLDDNNGIKSIHRPLVDTFRFMRNACAGIVDNVISVVSQPALLNSTVQLVRHFSEGQANVPVNDSAGIAALQCGLQFLGNLVSSCDEAKELVWKAMFVQDPSLFSKLLADKDAKVRLHSSMLLYNCLSPERCQALLADMSSSVTISCLTDMLARADSEWSLFTLGLLVQNDFFHHVYPVLDLKSRCVILDVIIDKLDKLEAEGEDSIISSSLLEYLCEHFRGRVMDIVKTAQPEAMHDDLDPVEIIKVLELLCAASIHPSFSSVLKENEALLEMVVDILKTVHFLGKAEKNVFSPVQHIDDLAEAQDGASELAENPVFGFKRKLVRLIGNLCHASRKNQDLVRNMEGIPLILDVCNLDARNPYIIQWAVLAVRNLLENNLENQAIVAGLVKKGVVTDSPLLTEMGVRLERVCLSAFLGERVRRRLIMAELGCMY